MENTENKLYYALYIAKQQVFATPLFPDEYRLNGYIGLNNLKVLEIKTISESDLL